MADQAEPKGSSGLSFAPEYFRTSLGIEKCVVLVVAVLCLFLIGPTYVTGSAYFHSACVATVIDMLLWLVIPILSLPTALSGVRINWLVSELLSIGIICVFLAITTLVHTIAWTVHSHYMYFGRNIAAGVFGLLNCLVMGHVVYSIYMELRSQQRN